MGLTTRGSDGCVRVVIPGDVREISHSSGKVTTVWWVRLAASRGAHRGIESLLLSNLMYTRLFVVIRLLVWAHPTFIALMVPVGRWWSHPQGSLSVESWAVSGVVAEWAVGAASFGRSCVPGPRVDKLVPCGQSKGPGVDFIVAAIVSASM